MKVEHSHSCSWGGEVAFQPPLGLPICGTNITLRARRCARSEMSLFLLTNVLLTVSTLQRVENYSAPGGKVVCLGVWLTRCSVRTALHLCGQNSDCTKNELNELWRRIICQTHTVPHKAERGGATLTDSRVLAVLCFWSFPLRVLALAQPGCLMWLYKVAHFVSLQGVSGLQCFHCESHPWVSFRRMRPYWESLSVFICLPFATDCIQLHSWIPTAVPRQRCLSVPPGSGTFSQTVAKGCLFIVAHDTANRTLDCV